MPATLPPVLPADVVLTLVESVGRREDAEFYLKLFRELPRHSFALVAPDAAALSEAEGRVVENLRLLAHLGLFAPVVLGLSAPKAALSLAQGLCAQLAEVGLPSQRREATETDLAASLTADLDAGRIPVVTFPPDGLSSRERFDTLGRLALSLSSRKLVIVRARGGLGPHSKSGVRLGPQRCLPTTERGISVINLRRDHTALQASGVLDPGEVELLEGIDRAMQIAAGDESIARDRLVTSVTAPINLLSELFTVKGAGTLVKPGSMIEFHPSYDGLDRERLSALLEATFGKPLRPEFLMRPPLGVYVEQAYRGAAIVSPHATASFLTKFVVDRLAQGLGVGRDLWEAVTADHEKLFWRSRPQNPISRWYESQCQGMVRTPDWCVYFRGVEHNDIPRLIREALAAPVDFGP